MSRAVRALAERGVVALREDAADSRRTLLVLTPAGEALHDKMIIASLAREELLLSGLTGDERRAFFRLIKTIAANMPLVDAHDPHDAGVDARSSPPAGARRASKPGGRRA